MNFGGYIMCVGCIGVWPEGADDFQWSGGNVSWDWDYTYNGAEDIARQEGTRRRP